MPKELSVDLRDCLRRANPYVEYRAELGVPDVGLVLRRPDQFIGVASLMVGSMSPASSLSTGAAGSLQLTGTSVALATFSGEQSSYDLNREDVTRRIKGMKWSVNSSFNRAVLSSFTATIKRQSVGGFNPFALDFELQIYRWTRTPGVRISSSGSVVQAVQWAARAISPSIQIKAANITWVSNKATLSFDLSNYRIAVGGEPPDSVLPDQVGEPNNYYFCVRPINSQAGNGLFSWYVDTATTRVISGVGTFERSFWARDSDQADWTEQLFSDVPKCVVNIFSYVASGQAVYVIDLGRAPSAGTTGRIVFEYTLPRGTTATLELSIAGSGGSWTAVKNGDIIATSQQTYHLRVTLTSDSANRATPGVTAMGIEFGTPVDVSLESIVALPTREIDVPWGKSSVAEASLSVLRTGIRDYLDFATVLGSRTSPPKLDANLFLASRHPAVTRDKWLRLERMTVSNRTPGPTSELLTLLSYSAKLKRKIPEKIESLSTVHTVSSSTTSQVVVSPALVGTTTGGNEYDGKGYYMRVRSTTSNGIPANFQQTILGSTDTTKLDFSPALPAALVAGDVIEVHSGSLVVDPITWIDQDPAIVWNDILNVYGGIPIDRIGHGSLPRGGYPPTIADRAPGDTATQAKLKVTNKLTDQKELSELLYQVSALMGGATVEIDGQVCFIQIYEQRAADGTVTVPLSPAVRTFDVRDIAKGSLSTPPGLERRGTVILAGYGKNNAATEPDDFPQKTTVTVDNDALAWLTKQDLEEAGSSAVPEEIAAWCYNTTDQGLLLASQLAGQVVRATSTGLRVFPFSTVEMQPDLLPGDQIILLTDQYTDYDPSTSTPLRGPLAIRGILTSVGNAGRALRMYVLGISASQQPSGGGRDQTTPPKASCELALWLKADSLLPLLDPDAGVGFWPDQSLWARHAKQPIGIHQPVFHVNAINGWPAVYFNSPRSGGDPTTQVKCLEFDDVFSASAVQPLTGAEVFIVLQKTFAPLVPSDYDSGLWRFGNDASNFTHYPVPTGYTPAGHILDGFGSLGRYDTGLAPIELLFPHIYNVTSIAGEWTNRFNGVQLYTRGTNTVAWNTNPGIGRSQESAVSSIYNFIGFIAEIMIYSCKLTAAERASTLQYLATKYAITI